MRRNLMNLLTELVPCISSNILLNIVSNHSNPYIISNSRKPKHLDETSHPRPLRSHMDKDLRHTTDIAWTTRLHINEIFWQCTKSIATRVAFPHYRRQFKGLNPSSKVQQVSPASRASLDACSPASVVA